MKTRFSKLVVILVWAVLITTALISPASATALPMHGDIFAADYWDGVVHRYNGRDFSYEGVFCTRATGLLGLTFLPDGDLAVTSSRENKVLRYDVQTGNLEGVIFDRQISNPRGVVSGPDGTLWITARDNNVLVGVNPNTGAERYRGTISYPMAVAAGNDRVYVTSQTGGTVHEYDALTGQYLGILASGLGSNPQAIGVCSDGSLLVISSNLGMFHIDEHDGHSLGFLAGITSEGISIGLDGMAYAQSEDGALCRIDPTNMVIVDRLIENFAGTHGIALYSIPEPSTLALLSMGGVGLVACGSRRRKAHRIVVCFIALLASTAWMAKADVYNMGGTRNADGTWTGLASLETVLVGNVNNSPDANTGNLYGSVDHTYAIGKYEVTAGQYCEFLNAKAKTDTYGLYNFGMWSSSFGCKIQRTGNSGSYAYSVSADYANRPVNYVSFWGRGTVHKLALQRPGQRRYRDRGLYAGRLQR